MNTSLPAATLAAALLLSAPVSGADDLAAIRLEIEKLRESYENRIADLEKRLLAAEVKTAESRPAAYPSGQAGPAPAPAPGRTSNPEIGLVLQGRYAHLDDRAERSISGLISGGGHEHGATGRGFSIDHSELMLSASIDPYLTGKAALAFKEGAAEVEEAWFQTTALSPGLSLKGGRFRSAIGYQNEQHPHQWDFATNNLIYQWLFGESLLQDGVQLKWVAPAELYFDLGMELGRGLGSWNDNGAGTRSLFAHLGGDLGISHSWRAGLSWIRQDFRERDAELEDLDGVTGETLSNGQSRIAGADFVWKWAPNGDARTRNLKFQGEIFRRHDLGDIQCFAADPGSASLCANSPVGSLDTRHTGWYAQGAYQFMPRWRTGYRHERIGLGSANYGDLDAVLMPPTLAPVRNSLMLDYSPSEFSRVRLQYTRDKSNLQGAENQFYVQYVMSLGAHGAHPF